MLFLAQATDAIETAVTTPPAAPPAAPTLQAVADPALLQQVTQAVENAAKVTPPSSTPIWVLILVPVATIIAAVIAGTVAARTARKGPHENLKALLDIREALILNPVNARTDEEELLPANVVGNSILREVERLEKLNTARSGGWWKYQRARIKDAFSTSGSDDGARRPFWVGAELAFAITVAVAGLVAGLFVR